LTFTPLRRKIKLGEQKAKIDWFSPMKSAILKAELLSVRAELASPHLSVPRGAITGRTSLLLSILAAATAHEEFCALVDANDTLDPASAAAAGINLKRLLWVRCGGNPEHALKAADLLVQGGGFGVVAMDLADVEPHVVRRIPLACWFRLRRAVEYTPTVLIVVEREPCVKTCASLMLEMKRDGVGQASLPARTQTRMSVPLLG
jgi:hypothetical protein